MKQAPELLNDVPILFTREESRALMNICRHLRKVTDERAEGWQLELIANIGKVNRIIHRCIRRGHRAPDPRQMSLPS